MANGQQTTHLYFVHAVSPLHAGTGEGLDAINLPTAREQATHYPYLPGSSIKGVLREAAERRWDRKDENVVTAFGPPTENAADARGGLVFTDASLLALPVRSLFGTFAWVTCPFVLKRLARDAGESAPRPHADAAGKKRDEQAFDSLRSLARGGKAQPLVAPQSALEPAGGQLFLQDLRITGVAADDRVAQAGQWIADRVWPMAGSGQPNPDITEAHTFFQRRLVVVQDDVFGFFARTATEVRSRVKIDHDRGTAASSGPWTEEHIPAEALLHGLVIGRSTRYFKEGRRTDEKGQPDPGNPKSAGDSIHVLLKLLDGTLLRFGGKSTAGMGRARFQVVAS